MYFPQDLLQFRIFPSATFSRPLSIQVRETEFHNHTKQQAKLHSFIFQSLSYTVAARKTKTYEMNGNDNSLNFEYAEQQGK